MKNMTSPQTAGRSQSVNKMPRRVFARSSEQTPYPSLPRKRESSVISLLLLFLADPLRWALREIISIIFSGGVYVGENTLRGESVFLSAYGGQKRAVRSVPPSSAKSAGRCRRLVIAPTRSGRLFIDTVFLFPLILRDTLSSRGRKAPW